MFLLEFLCCKTAPIPIRARVDETYLVGVWVNRKSECEAFDVAARELWSRGFIVLRHKGLFLLRQRCHSPSKLLNEVWDDAERNGVSFLVAETSVRLSGSKIRGVANAKSGILNELQAERIKVESTVAS